jgi:hypothetical protein
MAMNRPVLVGGQVDFPDAAGYSWAAKTNRGHAMVVTGVRTINGRRQVKVSTWGRRIWLDYGNLTGYGWGQTMHGAMSRYDFGQGADRKIFRWVYSAWDLRS